MLGDGRRNLLVFGVVAVASDEARRSEPPSVVVQPFSPAATLSTAAPTSSEATAPALWVPDRRVLASWCG